MFARLAERLVPRPAFLQAASRSLAWAHAGPPPPNEVLVFAILGTRRTLRGPLAHIRQEIFLRRGNRCAPFARSPSPEHQRRVHVLYDLLRATTPILIRILQQLAKLAVAQPFPDHRYCRGRQMPAWCSRRSMQTDEVVILMATAAMHRVDSMSGRTSMNPHGMRMAVVALARIVAAGMTIHAPRMPKNRNEGFKRRCRGSVVLLDAGIGNRSPPRRWMSSGHTFRAGQQR